MVAIQGGEVIVLPTKWRLFAVRTGLACWASVGDLPGIVSRALFFGNNVLWGVNFKMNSKKWAKEAP